MNTASQSIANAQLIIKELENLGKAEPQLIAFISAANAETAQHAAIKLWRLWDWPRMLATLVFRLKLSRDVYAELQYSYIEHGLSDAFLSALDQAIAENNTYLDAQEKNNDSYRSLSVLFHKVLNSVLQNFPESNLSDEEIARLELEYLSSADRNENILRGELTSKFRSRKNTPT